MRKAKAHEDSLAMIRAEQRSEAMPVWPYAVMKRLLVEMAKEHKADISMEPRFVRIMYDKLEAYMIRLLQCANHAAIASKRVYIEGADLRLARALRGECL